MKKLFNPSFDELKAKGANRYTLSLFLAKRARELVDGAEPLIETDSNRAVSIALEEFFADKIAPKENDYFINKSDDSETHSIDNYYDDDDEDYDEEEEVKADEEEEESETATDYPEDEEFDDFEDDMDDDMEDDDDMDEEFDGEEE